MDKIETVSYLLCAKGGRIAATFDSEKVAREKKRPFQILKRQTIVMETMD